MLKMFQNPKLSLELNLLNKKINKKNNQLNNYNKSITIMFNKSKK